METYSRIVTGFLLINLTYLAYVSQLFFINYISILFYLGIKELSQYDYNNKVIAMMTELTLTLCICISNLEEHKTIMTIFLYNSVSDIIQFFVGRYFGRVKLFSFTSKTLEGYIAGLCLTHFFFYHLPLTFILLNLVGMFGGIMSSLTKRELKIKHWSNVLGKHGGINDRIDSIVLPILVYYYIL